jgi:hypothetical protein
MRLNSGYRAEIVRAAIENAFSKEEKVLLQREHALAKRSYETLVTPKTRRWLDEAPKGWLPMRTHIELNVAGLSVTLHLARESAIPDSIDGKYQAKLGSIPEGVLANEIQELLAAQEAVKARKKTAHATLQALVEQHTTTDDLAKAWPEGKAFLVKLERKVPVPNLPAVRIEDLNKMLGLEAA